MADLDGILRLSDETVSNALPHDIRYKDAFTQGTSNKRISEATLGEEERPTKRPRVGADDDESVALTDSLLQVMIELVEETVKEQMEQSFAKLASENNLAMIAIPKECPVVPRSQPALITDVSVLPRVIDQSQRTVVRNNAYLTANALFRKADIISVLGLKAEFGANIPIPQIMSCGEPSAQVRCILLPPNVCWDRCFQTAVPFAMAWNLLPGCVETYRHARGQGQIQGPEPHETFVKKLYKEANAVYATNGTNQKLPYEYLVPLDSDRHVAVFKAQGDAAAWAKKTKFRFEGYFQICKVALFSSGSQALKDMLKLLLPKATSLDMARHLSHAWAVASLQFSDEHESPPAPTINDAYRRK